MHHPMLRFTIKMTRTGDRGSYDIFCRSIHRPDTVTCRFQDTWECTPVKNNEWVIYHCHLCNDNSCSLHTIAIPKNEYRPIAMFIFVIIISIIIIINY